MKKSFRLIAVFLAALMLTIPICTAVNLPDMSDPMESVVRLGKYSSKIDPTIGFKDDCIVVFVTKPWYAPSPYNDFKVTDFPNLELSDVKLLPGTVDSYSKEAYALYLKNPGRRQVAEAIVALENDLGVLSECLDSERVFPCPAISLWYDYLDLEGKFTGTLSVSLNEIGEYGLNTPTINVIFNEAPGIDPIEYPDLCFHGLDVASVETGYFQNMWMVTLKHDGRLMLDMWRTVYDALKLLNDRKEIKEAYAEIYEIADPCIYIPTATDYSSDEWFAPYVSYVCIRNWMSTERKRHMFTESRYNNNGELVYYEIDGVKYYFHPDMSITRSMLATILYRMATEEVKYDKEAVCSAFTDVPAGQWYTEAVQWAYENGIVEGVGDGMFAPDREITREEFVTIMYRYHTEWNDSPVRYKADFTDFEDADKVSDWARDSMSWAVGNLLINGRDGGLIAPADSITRAEAAKIIMRYDDYVPKK